ncbi:unnamed protein product [Ectocarpus sp. CCAP 1310/34]|nr:unnamed protein product [Ectocarpus sp. CCAP 1310/34]
MPCVLFCLIHFFPQIPLRRRHTVSQRSFKGHRNLLPRMLSVSVLSWHGSKLPSSVMVVVPLGIASQ